MGTLLIRAAQLEAQSGTDAMRTVQGAGDPALAADLLRKARQTASEDATEGWTEDEMRGHLLIEKFMEEHALDWNRARDGETHRQANKRSADQLRQLLWAGLKTLATLASSLRHVNNAWQLLHGLGDDEVVALLAELETERIDATIDQDQQEMEAAAAAHAAIWLAIHRPVLLNAEQCQWIIDIVIEDTDTFHQLVYSTLVMAGTGPVRAAVDRVDLLAETYDAMTEFVRAQTLTDPDDGSPRPFGVEAGEAYNDMHRALEEALDDDGDLYEQVCGILAVVGVAAELTATEVNSHLGMERYISAPHELTRELLKRAAEHAAVILSEEESDSNGSVRLSALSMIAQIAPDAAGEMTTDLPDLASDDPRDEPAARARAHQWVVDALRLVQDHSSGDGETKVAGSPDAQLVCKAIMADEEMPKWPIQRLVAAAAEATASLLQASSLSKSATQIFMRR
ncbi:hypothetical protein [Nonomuraea sp. CA-141351]|uniref:hypothetical protein n=1 Tax=Nonomuraea sp. CA-141351 TaxID=3239996 RepID=UPI003D92A770